MSQGSTRTVKARAPLWKRDGTRWVTVAQGTSPSSEEDVAYDGTPGYYMWRIASAKGSGSYRGGFSLP